MNIFKWQIFREKVRKSDWVRNFHSPNIWFFLLNLSLRILWFFEFQKFLQYKCAPLRCREILISQNSQRTIISCGSQKSPIWFWILGHFLMIFLNYFDWTHLCQTCIWKLMDLNIKFISHCFHTKQNRNEWMLQYMLESWLWWFFFLSF